MGDLKSCSSCSSCWDNTQNCYGSRSRSLEGDGRVEFTGRFSSTAEQKKATCNFFLKQRKMPKLTKKKSNKRESNSNVFSPPEVNRGNVGDRGKRDRRGGEAHPDPEGAKNPTGSDTSSQGDFPGSSPTQETQNTVDRGNVTRPTNVQVVNSNVDADQPAVTRLPVDNAAYCGDDDVAKSNKSAGTRDSGSQEPVDQTVPDPQLATIVATGAGSGYQISNNPGESPEPTCSVPKTKNIPVLGSRLKPAGGHSTVVRSDGAAGPARKPEGAIGTARKPEGATGMDRKPDGATGTSKDLFPGHSGQGTSGSTYRVPKKPAGGNTKPQPEGAVKPSSSTGREVSTQYPGFPNWEGKTPQQDATEVIRLWVGLRAAGSSGNLPGGPQETTKD